MAASIRSRLVKLERRVAPYRRMLSETELVERVLSQTQQWSDEEFLTLCDELKSGCLSTVTWARLNERR